eukprot:CAMPEP_0170197012 /NCGR_PEP_ID=MMETSP0040_2-20121228/65353_1 /TAXON_ID=641309 /ORGANISM="Lotharella oceanica, Strain CCMP622" /LENGTH=364 /DNA_ID=CAMNT_0010446603 /DNA_START=116 /DNA_END=1208 /DNA_ORIENTATION=+
MNLIDSLSARRVAEKFRQGALGSFKQNEPEKKEIDDEIAEEVFQESIFTNWPKKLPETETLRKKNLSWWEIFEIYYNDHHQNPPNEICKILFKLVSYHDEKQVVGEAFRVLSAFITQKKLFHGQSEETVWYMTDTRKRLRCGKRNTKSKSSLNSWIPTASDIMESLTEYGVEVEALRQRFEQNNRNGDRKNEHGAKSNDISSFPWHNLEKLLELLGMAMQYRGSEFQRCELAFVAFVLCSLLESTYLKRDVGSACRHRVRTVIGDIILAIEEPRESEKNPPMKFVWKIIEACETASSKLTVVESIPTSTSSVKKLRRLLAVKTLRTLVAKESAETCSSTNSKKIDEQNIITNANEILSRAMKVW